MEWHAVARYDRVWYSLMVFAESLCTQKAIWNDIYIVISVVSLKVSIRDGANAGCS